MFWLRAYEVVARCRMSAYEVFSFSLFRSYRAAPRQELLHWQLSIKTVIWHKAVLTWRECTKCIGGYVQRRWRWSRYVDHRRPSTPALAGWRAARCWSAGSSRRPAPCTPRCTATQSSTGPSDAGCRSSAAFTTRRSSGRRRRAASPTSSVSAAATTCSWEFHHATQPPRPARFTVHVRPQSAQQHRQPSTRRSVRCVIANQGPSTLPVFTGRVRGRKTGNVDRTPVFTARVHGCHFWHPQTRAVNTWCVDN